METNGILLVEDGENDIFLIQAAFKKAQIANPLHVVRSGEEALAYFAGEGVYADRKAHPPVSLVLLDLVLPKMTGLEVLQRIRSQPALNGVMVVVLTAHNQPENVEKAYRLGANSVLAKAAHFKKFDKVCQALVEYWFKHNQTVDGGL